MLFSLDIVIACLEKNPLLVGSPRFSFLVKFNLVASARPFLKIQYSIDNARFLRHANHGCFHYFFNVCLAVSFLQNLTYILQSSESKCYSPCTNRGNVQASTTGNRKNCAAIHWATDWRGISFRFLLKWGYEPFLISHCLL